MRGIHRQVRNRNISALLSTTLVILLILLISIFLGRAIVSGLRDIYQSLSGAGETRERLSFFIVQAFDQAIALANRYIPISASDLQTAVSNQAEKAVAALIAMSAGALGSATSLAVNSFIAFFILFFLFRDARSMLRRAAILLPLSHSQATRLFQSVKNVLHAIVYGTLAVAAIQGTLAGFAFWVLGVFSPAIWGVITALLCNDPGDWHYLGVVARNLHARCERSLDQGLDSPVLGTCRRASRRQSSEALSHRRPCKAPHVVRLLRNPRWTESFWRPRSFHRASDSRRDNRALQLSQRGKTGGRLALRKTI